MIDELHYNLEMARYTEMLSLAALETAKANCREKELAFERDRFNMESLKIFAKQSQDQQTVGVTPPPVPTA